MHVHDREVRTASEQHPATISSTLRHVVETVAVHLKPKPDLSLMNEKFSDSFEREHLELLSRNRW